MSGVRKFAKIAMNLDAWTVAYVGGMTTKPTSAHIQLIDKFVKTTKSILSTKADVFYFGNINNSNDSFRNLVKNAHHGTIQGSDLVWDNLVGFTNPNGTGWVDTNYNPATQGVKYTLNDAGIGVNFVSKYTNPIQTILSLYDGNNTSSLWNYNVIHTNYYQLNCNDVAGNSSIVPFKQGFHNYNRTNNASVNYINQNIPNNTKSVISMGIPNHNVTLFHDVILGSSRDYKDLLNCVYIGASLTNDEYMTLNNAINEYLIACLFLKYGNDNWGVKMAKSYFYDLHGFEKYEAFEVYEFIKRHQPEYLSKDDPDYNRNNIIPYASSHFDTDGTAWWNVGVGTLSYNDVDKCLQLNSTGAGFIWKTIATRYYNNFRVRFKFRSSTYTGSIKTYIGSATPTQTANCTTSWQQADLIITGARNGVFYILVSSAGTIELDDIELYEMFAMPELSVNSGAPGLSDWVDTTGDGLANGMSNGGYACTNSIVIGNGFTGNAQRAVENNTSDLACISIPNCMLTAGTQYLIRGKYRSSTLFHIKHSVDGLIKELPISVGNCKDFGIVFTPTNTGNLIFLTGLATAGAWLEIDEVSAQEVTSLGGELSVNTGAPGLTDFIDTNSDGLADGFSKSSGTATIVTGNGFVGNAQRLLAIANTNTSTTTELFSFTINKYYTLTFKHRSNDGIGLVVYDGAILVRFEIPANAGICIPFSISFKALTTTTNAFVRFYVRTTTGDSLTNDFIELDEISIKEITTSGTELCINTGNASTTDWADDPDGLANGWSTTLNTSYPSVASIVTGNGFFGNAQRVVENNTSHMAYIAHGSIEFVAGKTYQLSGKYRCSGGIRIFLTSQGVVKTLTDNTSNATSFNVVFTCTVQSYLMFLSTTGAEGNWFEIDEISVKEAFESDTVNFNKVLNSGFGPATDFVDTNGDGLADGWGKTNNGTPTIVTGNGFTKRAQRSYADTSASACIYTGADLVFGRNYTLIFKHRSNNKVQPFIDSGGAGSIASVQTVINTGDAEYFSMNFTVNKVYVNDGLNIRFYLRDGNTQAGDWIEISEVLIIDNSNSQFYYNVFGPNGLNRSVADYLMLFKAGGNLLANAWIKSGATLRWNHDAGITNSNTMPAYTRGSNLGIVTVSSTDGWNGVTNLVISQTSTSVNSYYGNMPKFFSTLKTGGTKSRFQTYSNRFRIDFRNQQLALLSDSFYNTNITNPGGIRVNISDLVGGSYSSFVALNGDKLNSWAKIIGDVTPLTNEFDVYVVISNDNAIFGSLRNIIIGNALTYIAFQNTSITEGTTVWNKNVATFILQLSKLPTSAVNAQLKVINDYFTLNTPIKNVSIDLSGASMGIPTGGANNTDLLGIIAKHVAAGFVATISVRTV